MHCIHYISLKQLVAGVCLDCAGGEEIIAAARENIRQSGTMRPAIINIARKPHYLVMRGSAECRAAEELGYKAVPVMAIEIKDAKLEERLVLKLELGKGEWKKDMLAALADAFLVYSDGCNLELHRIMGDGRKKNVVSKTQHNEK